MNYRRIFEKLLRVRLKPNSMRIVWTKCPFHEEDNMSLEIDVKEGICYCHAGCGGNTYYGFADRLGKQKEAKECCTVKR